MPLLTASIHHRHVSFRDLFSTEMAEWKVSKVDARKMDTPLSWKMLLGRELLGGSYWTYQSQGRKPDASKVVSFFISFHLGGFGVPAHPFLHLLLSQ
jgi:hypothetical protein